MCKLYRLGALFIVVFGISLGLGALASPHSGIVDLYGCHVGRDKVSYHCHEGPFVGRTFKSREAFLRELRGGKSERLAPKNNSPLFEKKPDD
jgi:hypothetical protein